MATTSMVRSIVLHDIPISRIAAMERWYYKDHSPEIVRRYGPWSVRHDSYLPVAAPDEARRFGFFNWRLTEGWWRDLPKPGPQGALSFTPPPVWPRVACCFTPFQPTEDFLGHQVRPHERQVLRWFVMFKYPDGVSAAEGERWYLDTHVPEATQQPGLWRFFSYRVIREHIPLPGTWADDGRPPTDSVLPRWDRVSEMWYESFDDWRRSVLSEPPAYTAPPWASCPAYPFLRPGVDFVSTFVLERPTDEFLRDARSYL